MRTTPTRALMVLFAAVALLALMALLALSGCGGGDKAPATADAAKPEATAGAEGAAPSDTASADRSAEGTATPGAAGGETAQGQTPPAGGMQGMPGATPGAAATPPPPLTPSGPQDEVIAKVNGTKITRGELDFTVKNIVGEEQQVPAEQQAEFRKRVLSDMIDRELIYQQAVAKKIAVTDAEMADSISKVRSSFPDEAAFQAQLAKDGMTVEGIKGVVKHALVIDKYVRSEIMKTINVTPQEEAKFYEENKERMKRPEAVHASHILLSTKPTDAADAKAAAKTKAEEALAKAKKGDDFAALAKQYSQDTGSAQRGGDLGFFVKGQMTPPFEAAAFALKPGEISNVVETDFGYHVIKLIERRPPGYAPIDEVRPRIKDYLANQKTQAELQRQSASLREKAKVEMTL